ncbi:ArdC family protein [Sphaerotilus uruguayifluvii]|uniref:Antirestriction protein ArdC n=1 Tax=Sphaerotilus uruguayifluvii TaxID=2735897 RepID=A0ABX2G9A7_9BURK|nr:zincin-like metallopeptidase domain-containing protein [Leptothrix sp. C29]NRT58047.1 antirestriction protein ArdC [Leptothrix sp. C29]
MSSSRMSEMYQEVTRQLVAAMRAGTAPWQRPWSAEQRVLPAQIPPFNPVTGTRYRGLNRLKLTLSSIGRDCRWLTSRQIEKHGLSLRPGSQPERIFFWLGSPEDDEDLARSRKPGASSAPVKWHTVYNGSDVPGLDDVLGTVTIEPPDFDVNLNVVAVMAASEADIIHGGNHACYCPQEDRIRLPWRRQFHSAAGYASTALHELAHWSGHPSRQARDLSGRFGSHAYALEELRAEMASVFVAVELGVGLTAQHVAQHAAYLDSWCRALESDERALQRVATDAQKIADHLLNLAPHRVKLPGRVTPVRPPKRSRRAGGRTTGKLAAQAGSPAIG